MSDFHPSIGRIFRTVPTQIVDYHDELSMFRRVQIPLFSMTNRAPINPQSPTQM